MGFVIFILCMTTILEYGRVSDLRNRIKELERRIEATSRYTDILHGKLAELENTVNFMDILNE